MNHMRLFAVMGVALTVSACSPSFCRTYEEPKAVVAAAPAPAPAPDPCKDVVRLYGVNFDFDSADLRSDALPVLDEVVMALKKCPAQRVEISAHTDSKGSEMYNQNLSERRGGSVETYLVSQGINDDVLDSTGYGETQPIAPNTNADGSDNPEGRAKNRRVELRPIM